LRGYVGYILIDQAYIIGAFVIVSSVHGHVHWTVDLSSAFMGWSAYLLH
jgi:hypothetical protein